MKCLRCGYCCFQYDVVIVDDLELGPNENNVKIKRTGERCQHLRGSESGKFSCAIHDKPWYKDTPCYSHGQIESDVNDPCRIGVYVSTQSPTQIDKLLNMNQLDLTKQI